MRRFLTLICLLGLAMPAGISISGCVRNPAGNYCNGLGYGITDTQVSQITLQPQVAGISLAYGQTTQVQVPTATTCKGTTVSLSSFSYSYATTNNQLVDISPTGSICAGTWNRNTGGGIANYTYCYLPNPLPSTNGLPYSIAYITATAYSVTSNPVEVYIHAPVTSISLVTTSLSSSPIPNSQQCFSQNQQAQLNAQGCFASGGQQYELCAPPSVNLAIPANIACPGGLVQGVTPNIVASGTFTAPTVANGSITGTTYLSGASVTGTEGQTCNVSNFNGFTGASATIQLSAANTINPGTPLTMTSGGSGPNTPPTTATLSSGTATCSGTIQLTPIYGTVGQYCYLNSFNNGSVGATATVSLTGPNTIAGGTLLSITSGGGGATAPPTTALLSSGTANCGGTAAVATTLTPVPSCGSSIGTLSFSVGSSSVATINATTNVITAEQPGTTAITATIAQSASSAGYFSTCPPQSISISLANGSTKGVVTQGVTQNLTTTVLDINNAPITGLSLTYQSTNPIDINAGSGTITTSYPGAASINAVCEPPTCNPAPINEIGLYGTGLPISSNPVSIVVPGTASDFVWFGAPGQSQYIASIELLTGNPGSTVKLPYVPNSMVMDRLGNNIYFGSPHELMIYSLASSSLTTQNTGVPGVVLAASPNASQLLISDQIRGLFYLYNTSGGSTATFGGLGNAAAWTADSQTLYITDNANLNTPSSCGTPLITGHTDTLYVYNANSGWSTYPLPPSPLPPSEVPTCDAQPNNAAPSAPFQTPAVTIPGVGAYMRGDPTVAHTWCPGGLFPSPPNVGVVGNNASISFYPQPVTDSEPVESDALAATTDGDHILGAALTGSSITLNDIGVSIPPTTSFTAAECPVNTAGTPQTMTPLSTNPVPNGTAVPMSSVTNAAAVNQVVTGAAPTTASVTTAAPIAFITYNAPNTATTPAPQLPYYLPLPNGSGAGPVGYVTFCQNILPTPTCTPGTSATPPTAPLAGAFSPDNSIFFVSTQGDNEVHFISIPVNLSTSAPTDTQQISPNLPACTPVSDGGDDAGCLYPTTPNPTTYVPATVIEVKPRSVT